MKKNDRRGYLRKIFMIKPKASNHEIRVFKASFVTFKLIYPKKHTMRGSHVLYTYILGKL